MSARKISDLPPAATPLTGAELIPGVQTGASVRLAAADLANLTRTTTPAFMAYQSATVNDTTGDGTIYDLVFDTTAYDRGNHYDKATGVFTAPVPGIYEFQIRLALSGADATMNRFALILRSKMSGVDIQAIGGDQGDLMPDVSGRLAIGMTAPLLLAAGEQVYLKFGIFGSGKTVDTLGMTAGPPINYGSIFCGRLVG